MGRDDRESELGGWQLELEVRLTSLYMGEEDRRGVCPFSCETCWLVGKRENRAHLARCARGFDWSGSSVELMLLSFSLNLFLQICI